MKYQRLFATRIGACLALAFSACNATDNPTTSTNTITSKQVLKTDLFSTAALTKDIATVDCTLANGDAAQCAEFVLKYIPRDLSDNTFCPQTLNDVGGMWDWDGENPGLYRLDGTFFRMLDSVGYTFFDDEGNINIADIRVSEPTVEHACIQVSYDDTVEVTTRLPITPRMAETESTLGVVSKVGLALDGAPIFSDAPSVKQTGHMPGLDRCGGHIDPGGWYHWHATASDINTPLNLAGAEADCALEQAPSSLFGYAFDGFPIYGSADQGDEIPADLDNCNGHISATPEYPEGQYHYHATASFPNLPKCLKGVVANNNFSTTAQAGVGGTGGGNNPPRPGGNGGPPGGGPPGGGPPPDGGGNGLPPGGPPAGQMRIQSLPTTGHAHGHSHSAPHSH